MENVNKQLLDALKIARKKLDDEGYFPTKEIDSAIAAAEQAQQAEPAHPCWSCSKPVTMGRRAAADGNCPHCGAELDLDDWPPAQQQAEPVGVLVDVLVKFVDIMDDCGNWPDNSTSQVKLGDLAKEAVAAIGRCRAVQSKPAQPPAVAVPDGYALVPAVATDRMTWVGQSMRYDREISIGAIYRAMLAAAMEQPK